MKWHILKMQRTSNVYTLKVAKILAYEEETPNYVQISCIGECAPEIQKQINTWILTVMKIREKIIYHKKK